MGTAKPKLTPWNEIKKKYLEGVTPKELSVIYKVSAKDIGDKASHDGWVAKKREISGKVEQTVQDRIVGLTSKALNALEEVLDTSDNEANKISAARHVIDVSGLKSVRNIVDAGVGFSLFFQKVEEKAKIIENKAKMIESGEK